MTELDLTYGRVMSVMEENIDIDGFPRRSEKRDAFIPPLYTVEWICQLTRLTELCLRFASPFTVANSTMPTAITNLTSLETLVVIGTPHPGTNSWTLPAGIEKLPSLQYVLMNRPPDMDDVTPHIVSTLRSAGVDVTYTRWAAHQRWIHS